jgi:hypothetical protein
MSCCKCPVQPCPSRYATWLPRIGFGLAFAGFGVSHYRDLATFVSMTQAPFASISFLAMILGWLAYVLPALEIAGGVLFAVGQMKCVAKTCILASIGGIMGWAGLGMMVGDMSQAMMLGTAFQGGVMALIGYWIAKKMTCCGSMSGACATGASCATAGACGCGKGGACGCGKGGACGCGK